MCATQEAIAGILYTYVGSPIYIYMQIHIYNTLYMVYCCHPIYKYRCQPIYVYANTYMYIHTCLGMFSADATVEEEETAAHGVEPVDVQGF